MLNAADREASKGDNGFVLAKLRSEYLRMPAGTSGLDAAAGGHQDSLENGERKALAHRQHSG